MTQSVSAHHADVRTEARHALLRSLARFEGTPRAFAERFVVGVASMTGARAVALLRAEADGRIDLIAASPVMESGEAPVWLSQAADLYQPDQPVRRLSMGSDPDLAIIVAPLESRVGGARLGLVMLVPSVEDRPGEGEPIALLPLLDAVIELYESRAAQTPTGRSGAMLERAVRAAEAVNGQLSAAGAAFALVNHVASAWNCDRAAVGMLHGSSIRLEAMSHSERFVRATRPVRDLEAAMDECLDQDTEIIVPRRESDDAITRQHEAFASAHGPFWILSLPLRHAGRVRGVLTVERPSDLPLGDADAAALRLACDLAAPRLIELAERDRWIGARAAAAFRESASRFLGAEHTWAKLLAIGMLGLIVFATLVKGPYTAGAPFVLRSEVRRVVPAPFDGYIEAAPTRPGDSVTAGSTVLATLRSDELRLELAEVKARESAAATQAAMARADGKIADGQIAEAARQEAAARAAAVEHRLSLAEIRAPIDGVVVKGELDQRLGGPVRAGEPLFEVASLARLHAELEVAEDQVNEVQVGQQGELATAARPTEPIRFAVESIDPLGESVGGRVVFRVRVSLIDPPEWLRPGMEGVSRIELGRRTYAFIWTRELVNWLRLRLWL